MLLPGQGIDAILGINWLRSFGVVLNLRQRIVELKLPSSEDRMSLLMSLVSTLPVIAHTKASLDLASIPVVYEFPDVFPKDLPRLPPDQDVEFATELELGTTHISWCPYRMAPKELTEIKKQLEELLEKGFIHPSSSPWGCPAIFLKKDDNLWMCVDYRSLDFFYF